MGGRHGETKLIRQEQELFEYGIRNERSDVRAHVCPAARTVCVYQTSAMINLIEKWRFKEAYAKQPGIPYVTGKGFLVPIDVIPDLRVLHPDKYKWETFPPRMAGRSELGAAAVSVVLYTMRLGRFPVWFDQPTEESNGEIQIEGADIILWAARRIQVKCDYCGGKQEWNSQCTGNLFIQTAERNPHKLR